MLAQYLLGHQVGDVACIGKEEVGQGLVGEVDGTVAKGEADKAALLASLYFQFGPVVCHAHVQRFEHGIEQCLVGHDGGAGGCIIDEQRLSYRWPSLAQPSGDACPTFEHRLGKQVLTLEARLAQLFVSLSAQQGIYVVIVLHQFGQLTDVFVGYSLGQLADARRIVHRFVLDGGQAIV